MKQLKKPRLSPVTLSLFVFIAAFSTACNFAKMNQRQREVEADLKKICEPLTIPGAAKLADKPISRDINKVVVWKEFRSDLSCPAIGELFRQYFMGLNWDPNMMSSEQSRGGMETLDYDFRQGEYLVSVECERGKANDANKEVVVSCSWGLMSF
jgi:hypothetical protein